MKHPMVAILALMLPSSVATADVLQAPPSEPPSAVPLQTRRAPPEVPFVPTPERVMNKMLELTLPTADDVVYDLGCGDGRIVVTAAKRYGARGVGVDIDPARVTESRENAEKEGVSDKVRIVNADLFKMDLREATVVTLYLLPDVNLRLRPKLLRELEPGTRIASHNYDMGDWAPDRSVEIGNAKVFYWQVPAKVAGTWRFSVPGTDGAAQPPATVRLDQSFQQLAGSGRLKNQNVRILDGKLEGKEIDVTFQPQSGATTRLRGRVDGARMEGHVHGTPALRWTAHRLNTSAQTPR